MNPKDQLAQLVLAFDAVGRVARLLYSWQNQRQQNRDDADNHQDFDYGDTMAPRLML